MEKVTIELTKQEAELFKLFREFQSEFELLVRNDVFSMKNGSIEIHKDDLGKIRKILINKIAFKC